MTYARFESVQDTAPFSFRQGNFDVTVLSDGYFALPAEIVAPEATSDEWLDIERRLGGTRGLSPRPAARVDRISSSAEGFGLP